MKKLRASAALAAAFALVVVAGCATSQRLSGTVMIDGAAVPIEELYPEDTEPVTIRPIGYVVNDRYRGPGDFGITGSEVSEIHLYPGMARFMKGLENETSLLILWHFHKAQPIRSVFARGWDGKRVGPFASRTCDRLTPIGVTKVELLEVKGMILVVRNLDAFDGTPVLDIKVSMDSLRRSKARRADGANAP